MKKTVFAAFVAFWSSIITVATLHAMDTSTATAASAAETQAAALPGYTLQQVAEHRTLQDCWMAIEGVVYDFTAYIPDHPTPPFVLEQWCGKDATEGMRTKGYGRDHTPSAWAMMEQYQVGQLVD
jgi:cytochrome b involved in lipid metabolism